VTLARDGIFAALDRAADRVLVTARGKNLTGRTLRARIAARAADLRRAGVQPGARALIVVSDNLAAVEQLLALWTLGAAGCFVDFRTPPARLAEWRDRLGAAFVLGIRSTGLTPEHLQPRDPDPVPDMADAQLPVTLEAEAFIRSSSGTTGLPKLHPLTHEALDGILLAQINEAEGWGIWDAEGGGAMLAAISVGYSASAFQWLRNLRAGRPIVALDLIHSLTELDAALRQIGVTECALPPAMIRRLASLPPVEGPRYPGLRRMISVGGPARPEDKLAAVTRLTPAYVMTYSCVGFGLISRITAAEVLARPASCGRPLPPVSVEIRDSDGLPCPPGEVGEIVVSNPRFRDHRPGDLGWLDAEGYLYVLGRVQGLLCRNGVSFRAERLVDAALALPDVAEAAVIALPDADGGDRVHLVVEAPATLGLALDEHLRRMLPVSERPDHVHLWDSLPLTAAGKVDLPRLRARVEEVADARS